MKKATKGKTAEIEEADEEADEAMDEESAEEQSQEQKDVEAVRTALYFES